MRQLTLSVNGTARKIYVEPDTPLLWVLRDTLGLTGTKYGCGMALCGACTVHVDGKAIRSCATPVSQITGGRITTIEGLSGSVGNAVHDAWIEQDVPQCGYCQSGQIMAAAALLADGKAITDAEIDQAMSGVLCRCGTYQRIRLAIRQAANALAGGSTK